MSPPRPSPEQEAAFRRLYDAAYADLLRFVQRRVHPSHAEDVVADTFLVAWRRWDAVPPGLDDARAWLFGTARHVLLNSHRGEQRRAALAVRIADATVARTEQTRLTGLDADEVACRVDIARAWRRLSPLHQETLALAVWDDLTAPQAAGVLGISAVAFRLRLSRARRALRAHLDSLPADAAAPAAAERTTP